MTTTAITHGSACNNGLPLQAGDSYVCLGECAPEPPARPRIGGWMQTFTGRAFYPLDPRPEDIDPVDIAHALGHLCRYGGHVRTHYSVAQHCVLMSEAVSPANALWALLHDATEAYVGDVIRPLKRALPAYVEIEDRLMDAICVRFGLDPVMPAEVKDADNRILLNEGRELLGPPAQSWGALEDLEPLDVSLVPWTARHAKDLYLSRLAELGALS